MDRVICRDRDEKGDILKAGVDSGRQCSPMLGWVLTQDGIEEVLTAPGSPWQNACCERLIGSIRRGCPDHIVVLNERQLLRVLRSHTSYYHASRTHRALDGDSPDGRTVELLEHGEVIAYPQVGGIHHRYARRAA
jgi:putative transposase